MPCGKPLRELQFTGRFGGAARHLQRRTEDEMRVAIGGVSPDGFPQPVDRGRHILFEPVGVPEVEEVVGIRRGLRCLGEPVGGQARLRRSATTELDHPEVVRDLRSRRFLAQHAQALERVVVSF